MMHADGGGPRPVLGEWWERLEEAGFWEVGTPDIRPS